MLQIGAVTFRGELGQYPPGWQARVTRNGELLTAVTYPQRDVAEIQLIFQRYQLDGSEQAARKARLHTQRGN